MSKALATHQSPAKSSSAEWESQERGGGRGPRQSKMGNSLTNHSYYYMNSEVKLTPFFSLIAIRDILYEGIVCKHTVYTIF